MGKCVCITIIPKTRGYNNICIQWTIWLLAENTFSEKNPLFVNVTQNHLALGTDNHKINS